MAHMTFYALSITLGNFEGVAILTLDDVKVDRDMNLELKASSATRRTDIVHIAPDGETFLNSNSILLKEPFPVPSICIVSPMAILA